MKATILVGDVLEKLKDIPSASVQCVVSSPPYWGLREYSTDPQIWGGDNNCAHEWIKHVQPAAEGTRTLEGNSALRAGNRGTTSATMKPKVSNFCTKCNAWKGELGLEPTPDLFVRHIVTIFREIKRVLRDDGTLWINIGDSYAGGGGVSAAAPSTGESKSGQYGLKGGLRAGGIKPQGYIKSKDLVGVPWMLAFALRADGWWLRQDIIWAKKSPMPESVRDRFCKSHEYIFLLSKRSRYYFDQDAVKEESVMKPQRRFTPRSEWPKGDEGRGEYCKPEGATNPEMRVKRDVWHISNDGCEEAHFAVFPEALVEPCILAGTSEHGACPVCGAPWRKIIETNNPSKWAADSDARGWANTHQTTSNPQSSKSLHRNGAGVYSTAKVLGWQPTCKCATDAPLQPCVVLDPFCGSGTTGVVALRYHRDFIGIELNPTYAKLAEKRIQGEMPLFASVEVA